MNRPGTSGDFRFEATSVHAVLVRAASSRRIAGDVLAVARAHWYLRGARSIGERVRLWGRPAVAARGDIHVGERTQLVSTLAPLELVTEPGAEIRIGSRCLVNFGTSIIAHERVTIGDRTLIGTDCMITDTGFHGVEPDRRFDPPPPQPVTIGENVWLAARVIVLPGVTIGDDAVIGIGSVVTTNIPPRALAVGSPARVVKEL